MRQFKIEARGLEAALGAVNAVSAQFSVESDDIIKAVRKAGAVWALSADQVKSAQQIFEEFVAFIAPFTIRVEFA